MKNRPSNELARYNHLIGETDAVYHEISRTLGLSDSAMQILYTICSCGDPCPLREIRNLCGMSKQTANSALRKLERDGILKLESAGAKEKSVRLTDDGREFAMRTAARLIRAENDILAEWDPEDVERYIALGEKYLSSLRDASKKIKEEQQSS